jgi:hypothetical protein
LSFAILALEHALRASEFPIKSPTFKGVAIRPNLHFFPSIHSPLPDRTWLWALLVGAVVGDVVGEVVVDAVGTVVGNDVGIIVRAVVGDAVEEAVGDAVGQLLKMMSG